jgi:transcriptional regulator with XRE-family HTH domain
MASLGGRIRERRVELEWTQGTLAEKAGISKGFLSDIENNKRGISAGTLLGIARVLGVSLDHLTTGSGTEPDVPQEIEIPASLAAFAKMESLSFRVTLTLLDMRQQIIAHRSVNKTHAQDDFDWRRFYESVRDFL